MNIPAAIVDSVRASCAADRQTVVAICLSPPDTWVTVNFRKERFTSGLTLMALASTNADGQFILTSPLELAEAMLHGQVRVMPPINGRLSVSAGFAKMAHTPLREHARKCWPKEQCESRGAAEAQMRSIVKRGLEKNIDTIHVYECPHCHMWHVGHSAEVTR